MEASHAVVESEESDSILVGHGFGNPQDVCENPGEPDESAVRSYSKESEAQERLKPRLFPVRSQLGASEATPAPSPTDLTNDRLVKQLMSSLLKRDLR